MLCKKEFLCHCMTRRMLIIVTRILTLANIQQPLRRVNHRAIDGVETLPKLLRTCPFGTSIN